MVNNNKFVYWWSSCLIILLFISFIGFSRDTYAYFGDGTTGSFTVYTVYYHSNYPEDVMLEKKYHSDKQSSNYNILLDNMFMVPDGYIFDCWFDEDGIKYIPGYEKFLKSDIIMYANWIKEEDNSNNDNGDDLEESSISYGDINLNRLIDEEDSNLLLLYVNGSSNLGEDVLINADVNNDKKIDMVDVDIIKNAFLGTNGYVGFLPNKPILIYDIYEGNIDIGNGAGGNNNSNELEGNGSSSNNGGSGSGNGGGGFGGGNSRPSENSGNGSGTNGNNSGSSNNHSSTNSSNDKVEDEKEEDIEIIVPEKKVFEFKYMNGNNKFDDTSCETTSDSCLIVLPSKNPLREGYTFKGWSKNKDCKGDTIIVTPVSVNSGNTYYACYLKNIESEDNGNKYYVWIIVFLISALSLRLIWHLIYKFRKDEENKDKIE